MVPSDRIGFSFEKRKRESSISHRHRGGYIDGDSVSPRARARNWARDLTGASPVGHLGGGVTSRTGNNRAYSGTRTRFNGNGQVEDEKALAGILDSVLGRVVYFV